VLDARPQDLDKLKLGSKLDVKVEGWDEEYTATVDFIPQRIETGNQRIAIRATLDNAGTKLQAGLSLRASLAESSATKDKLWIPERSVLWTGERSLVYKKENDRFLPTEVVLGEQSGGYWQVKSGLVLGDEIAVSGVFNLDAAAQLMGLESMMNRQPSIYAGVRINNESLAELLAAYWPLSEALVASDTEKGRLAAQRLSRVLSQLFADNQDDLPLRHYAEAMASSATDIKQQRKDFESFSADLYALIKAQDPEQLQLPSTLYWQYCPMAFDDQGAYWLSNQPDILNPYFGDMMLRCGETREEL
jgi:Cu(I)/Ag(I) efflux system membrane fusion protein